MAAARFDVLLVLPGMTPSTARSVGDFMRGSADVRALLAEADEVLGHDVLAAFSRDGLADYAPEKQVCFLINCVALARIALRELDRDRVLLAGPSFGAWTAAVVAGAMSFDEAVRGVAGAARTELEHERDRTHALTTVFFWRVPRHELGPLVDALVRDGVHVEPALDLDHELVGYTVTDPARVRRAVESRGGTWLYEMCPPAHSRLLGGVRADVARVLPEPPVGDLAVPVLDDHDGSLLTDAAAARRLVLDLYVRSVRWPATVRRAQGLGVERAVVAGPASLFDKCLRRTLPTEVITPDRPMLRPVGAR